MNDLINKLKGFAKRSQKQETIVIEEAINRIKELEDKVSDYEDDITDWQNSVENQMSRKKDEA